MIAAIASFHKLMFVAILLQLNHVDGLDDAGTLVNFSNVPKNFFSSSLFWFLFGLRLFFFLLWFVWCVVCILFSLKINRLARMRTQKMRAMQVLNMIAVGELNERSTSLNGLN